MRHLLGLFIYLLLVPFMDIIILIYSLWNIDDLSWGKTRIVVKGPDVEKEKVTELDGKRRQLYKSLV